MQALSVMVLYLFGCSISPVQLEEDALAPLAKGFQAKGKELPIQLCAARTQEMLLLQQHSEQANGVYAASPRHHFPHHGLDDPADNSSCSGAGTQPYVAANKHLLKLVSLHDSHVSD